MVVFTELAVNRRPARDPEDFRMQTRDLYIAPGDIGFWQAAIREAGDPGLRRAEPGHPGRAAVHDRVLYGDHEGGQRTITRFGMIPAGAATTATGGSRHVARHWNLDRPDPR